MFSRFLPWPALCRKVLCFCAFFASVFTFLRYTFRVSCFCHFCFCKLTIVLFFRPDTNQVDDVFANTTATVTVQPGVVTVKSGHSRGSMDIRTHLHNKLIQKDQNKKSQSYKMESLSGGASVDVHNFSLENKRETEYVSHTPTDWKRLQFVYNSFISIQLKAWSAKLLDHCLCVYSLYFTIMTFQVLSLGF